MKENYWDKIYWEKHLKEDDLENIEELWVKKYEEIFMNNNYKKVLDLGCGIGQYTNYFIEKEYEVVATDISKKALDYLSSKNSKVKTVLQDMTDKLEFNDNEFDIVFANLSIHFFSENDTKNLLTLTSNFVFSKNFLLIFKRMPINIFPIKRIRIATIIFKPKLIIDGKYSFNLSAIISKFITIYPFY
jgi:SAM-dependent methyltransferase